MSRIIDLVLHLDRHVAGLFPHYGGTAYLILFAILFAETGLVVMPFLPGDSLIFLTGALAASKGGPSLWPLALTFFLGAVAGDSVNYEIGKRLGPKLFRENSSIPFLKKENLERARTFFAKHGGKAIVIGRFVPIIRTFVPFVAGTGKMSYGHFLRNNVLGAALWVSLFLFGGYGFGNVPFVRTHFILALAIVILLSLIPVAYEFSQHKKDRADNDLPSDRPSVTGLRTAD